MPGCQTFTDDEICQLAMQESSTEPEDDSMKLTTISRFPILLQLTCLGWLEHQQEVNAYNTSLLRQFHRLAAHKRLHALKQTHIVDFFPPQ